MKQAGYLFYVPAPFRGQVLLFLQNLSHSAGGALPFLVQPFRLRPSFGGAGVGFSTIAADGDPPRGHPGGGRVAGARGTAWRPPGSMPRGVGAGEAGQDKYLLPRTEGGRQALSAKRPGSGCILSVLHLLSAWGTENRKGPKARVHPSPGHRPGDVEPS